jgi:hypothetical protein
MVLNPELYNTLIGIPYSLGIASIIVILFTTGSTSSHELYALQYSYIILACSVMFLFGLLWNKIDSGTSAAFTKIMTLFPFIMIMIITFGIPVLLYIYFDRISKGVSNYFTLFLNISTMLTVAQIWMFFKALSDPYFKSNNALNPKTFSLLTLLGTINLIVCVTLGVVLQYYATDC